MYTVITRNQCNFCDTAKTLLQGAGQGYTEYNVQSPSSKWVLSLMKQAGLKTVPQIFSSDGSHIGGYTELKEFLGKVEGSEV
jgi:glutaredoxin